MGKNRNSGQPALRQGGIYHLKKCPPLDGGEPKDRPVIIVDDKATLDALEPTVVVVACSTTVQSEDADLIEMPNSSNQPQCRTGLNKASWAVPRWFLVVDRARLDNYLGCIGGEKLKSIVRAYHIRLHEAGSS